MKLVTFVKPVTFLCQIKIHIQSIYVYFQIRIIADMTLHNTNTHQKNCGYEVLVFHGTQMKVVLCGLKFLKVRKTSTDLLMIDCYDMYCEDHDSRRQLLACSGSVWQPC